jgi:DNA ligase 1
MTAALLTDQIPANVTGWWVSEKYDGIRAIWTGSKLVSRNGRKFNAPDWFVSGLPRGVRLDGELWMGRGKYDELQSVIQRKGGEWIGVRYMVFDLVDVGNFEERDAALSFVPLPLHCKKVAHHELTGHDMLDDMESNIVSAGGEGCVIRRPGSEYRPGRAGDVIKIKRLVADIDRWHD